MEQVKLISTEFRIGNLCRDNVSKELLKVAELNDEGNIVFSVVNRDKYPLPDGWQAEPIPLSPELLEACGFEHKGGWMAGYFTTTIYDEQVEIVFEFMDNFLLVYANDQRVRKIDSPSLHTLMNLWHSITGTELSVNLEKVKV